MSKDTKWIIGTVVTATIGLYTVMDARFNVIEARLDAIASRMESLEERILSIEETLRAPLPARKH